MADRSHLSIGEVLSLLREEFPDVTVSKIRFLESQGLVDPERTPSGYRKFYDHDVDRLRWILRQQREHFLPLKVIRGRLTEQAGPESSGTESGGAESTGTESTITEPTTTESTGTRPVGNGAGNPASEPPAVLTGRPAPTGSPAVVGGTEPQPSPGATPSPAEQAAPAWSDRSVNRPAGTPSLFASLHNGGPAGTDRAAAVSQPTGDRSMTANEAAPGTAAPAAGLPHTTPAAGPTHAISGQAAGRSEEPETYTADELARAAGADPSLVTDLKQYGLIAPHAVVAGTQYYDPGAVAVARAAVQFARHGVEARHLRIWRNAADREADLFQQVVLPLLRQRNPQARRQAIDTLAELSSAGAELRAALVERALRDIR